MLISTWMEIRCSVEPYVDVKRALTRPACRSSLGRQADLDCLRVLRQHRCSLGSKGSHPAPLNPRTAA